MTPHVERLSRILPPPWADKTPKPASPRTAEMVESLTSWEETRTMARLGAAIARAPR